MKEPKRFRARAIVLAVVLTLTLTLGGVALAAWFILGPSAMTLLTGMSIISEKFVGEYNETEMVDAAMTGMVDGLGDRWSYYLDAESYADTQARRQNADVGVGITVNYENEEGLLIVAVTPGGPAEEAGLQAGELIVAVDGTSIGGEARYEGADLIQGEVGTTVTLTVRRADGSEYSAGMERRRLETEPVEYELLSGNVGYIQVKNFYRRSADGVKAAVEDLTAQGAEALVFDMRNNGGGYLDELTDMLDYLLPEGVIFRQEDRAGNKSATSSDASCVELPMATLVNRDTYSAAEFFGAELREWGVGVIVGEATSGKGYSQQTYPLPNGGGVGISTQKYFTGSGISLLGTGVTLDRELSLSEEKDALQRAGKLEYEEDDQLQAALELLKEKA